MSDRKEERYRRFYKCGWCKDLIEYDHNSDKPSLCPNCGWAHNGKTYKAKTYGDVPTEVRFNF